MDQEPEDTSNMDRDAFEEYAWNQVEDALWNKVEEVLWNDQFDLEKEEYARLQEFTGYGPYTTTAVGVLTFFGLRGGRLFWARHRPILSNIFRSKSSSAARSSNTSFQSRSSPPTSSSTTTTTLSPLATAQQYQQQSPPPPVSIPWTVFHALVDLSVSYMASILVPILLVDENSVAAACIDMPLLPGPSAIADTFCPVVDRQLAFLRQQQQQQQEEATQADHREALEKPSSGHLRALLEFHANCQVRQRKRIHAGGENSTTWEEKDWVDELTSDNERFGK